MDDCTLSSSRRQSRTGPRVILEPTPLDHWVPVHAALVQPLQHSAMPCQNAESSNALEFLILKNGLNGLICRPGLQTAPLGLSYSASCAIPAPGPLRQFGPLAIARAVLLPPEIIIGFIRAVHTHDVVNFNTLTKSGKMPSPFPVLSLDRRLFGV